MVVSSICGAALERLLRLAHARAARASSTRRRRRWRSRSRRRGSPCAAAPTAFEPRGAQPVDGDARHASPAAPPAAAPCARRCGCPRRPGWRSRNRPRRAPPSRPSDCRFISALIGTAREIVGAHLGKPAGVAADRRADGVADEGVGHGILLDRVEISRARIDRAAISWANLGVIARRVKQPCRSYPNSPFSPSTPRSAASRSSAARPMASGASSTSTAGRSRARRLKGKVLPGGADWQIVRADGVVHLQARYTIETDSGGMILVDAEGYRHGPAEVMERLGARRDGRSGAVLFPHLHAVRDRPTRRRPGSTASWRSAKAPA